MNDRCSAARKAMIEQQLRRRGIQDSRVLEAFAWVPRHLFVPGTVGAAAYDDCALPLGYGQTISQPYMVALMTSALAVSASERVLEVGTGSGYQACILARLVREVHTIERIPQLLMRARRVAEKLHLGNVIFHDGDGSVGWPEAAPYNRIIVTAAAPATPAPLLGQLADGGRLVIPIEGMHGYQVLKVLSKDGAKIYERALASVAFVPLRGKFGLPV